MFGADPATKVRLASVGRANDVWFRGLTGPAATTEPVDGRPDILVLTGAPNQDVWSLQNLGFTPDFMSVGALNSAAEDPLPGYDVVWNTGGWPSAANPVARTRLAGFFGSGGGYVGAGANGAAFLTSGSLTTGLTAATRSGDGRSAIVNWENTGGTASTVTGSAPARDTAIMDPPTWFTAVPASMAVDGRFPTDPADIVASGFWLLDEQSASAPGAAVIAHGTISQGAARATVFAMNPLYRADPEREWAMAGEALYWADQ